MIKNNTILSVCCFSHLKLQINETVELTICIARFKLTCLIFFVFATIILVISLQTTIKEIVVIDLLTKNSNFVKINLPL